MVSAGTIVRAVCAWSLLLVAAGLLSCMHSSDTFPTRVMMSAATRCEELPHAPIPEVPRPFTAGLLEESGGPPDPGDSGRTSLSPFYEALRQARIGGEQARVTFFGDSHTAADFLSGRLRAQLQERFGAAGLGLVPVAGGKRRARHDGVEGLNERGVYWLSATRRGHLRQARVGLSGFAAQVGRGAVLHYRLRTPVLEAGGVNLLQFTCLAPPEEGELLVRVNGELLTRVPLLSGDGSVSQLLAYDVPLPDGTTEVDLELAGDTLTLLDLSLERRVPGVIVDALGVPGATAREQLSIDDRLYEAQLRLRDPDLIVLAYGTNEAMESQRSLSEYREELHKVVTRARTAVPGAACLLLGPTDHPRRQKGRYLDRPRTGLLNNIQRSVAAELGCAFFDVLATMGGPLSMVTLREVGFGAQDHTHLTPEGYRALGDALSAALLEGYGRYAAERCGAAEDGLAGGGTEPGQRAPEDDLVADTSRAANDVAEASPPAGAPP